MLASETNRFKQNENGIGLDVVEKALENTEFITSHNTRYVKFDIVKSRGDHKHIALIINVLQLLTTTIVNKLIIC